MGTRGRLQRAAVKHAACCAALQEQRKGLKAQRRAALSGKALHDDFADDVAELVAAAGGADGYGPHLKTDHECSADSHLMFMLWGTVTCSGFGPCTHSDCLAMFACAGLVVTCWTGGWYRSATAPTRRSTPRAGQVLLRTQHCARLTCRCKRCGVQAPHWPIWTPRMRLLHEAATSSPAAAACPRLPHVYSCCVSTGDEDLPVRDPLHERRARYDSVKARHAAADGDGGGKRARNAEDADYLVGTLRSMVAQHTGIAIVCIALSAY